ncbi:DMT family transporter [Pseudovibrio sp. SPO723]|uniref:DMT family transporter n=1 Tax=Nesiotobacter zosterae TaxID=392721 RepID=UPI0029C187AD|nr:DMT family transporter [Pseudovibrio sp. SPO723]MDX5595406.1 DMT family transporter [Pseudovibrio sp. SPO723]
MTQAPKLDLIALAMLLCLSLLWGGSFFLAKIAVAFLPPLTLVFFRVFIAACTLWAVLLILGKRLPLHGSWPLKFLALGLINNVIPFSLLFWGQQHIASGLASVLNAFTPIFTMLVAHQMTQDERLSGAKILAGFVGICGVAVMLGADALLGDTYRILPQIACLGAALSYAFAATMAKRLKALPPLSIATGQLTGSTIILLPVILMTTSSSELATVPINTWAAVVMLAVVSTALAYLLYFRILQRAGATNAALVTFLVPVSAIMLGAVFLHERLEANQWLGIALIALALLIMDGRAFTRLRASLR